MISETDGKRMVGPAPIVWITGLSGAGKSTLARALVGELQRQGHRPLLLDGDTLRDALEPKEHANLHRVDMRKQRAWRVARLARLAAEQGVPVIVATISLFNAVHAWNRSGSAPYAEVLLQATIDALRKRKPELYGLEESTEPLHVVGVDIIAEFPLQPELLIVQRFKHEDIPQHLSNLMVVWQNLLQRKTLKA